VSADGYARAATRVERLLALRTFPGLTGVDPGELGVLAEVVEERFVPRGQALFPDKSPPRSLHFIRAGRVSVMRDGVPTRSYGAGDVVGAIAVLARDPRLQHVVAEEDTRTLEIAGGDLEDVLEESFTLLLSALRGTLRAVLSVRREIPGNAGFAGRTDGTPVPVGRGLVERVLFLRRLVAYGRGRVEALADLARDMIHVEFEAGAELWREGDGAEYSVLVSTGVVHCETRKGLSFRFGPESMVGGIDSLAGEPRWYRAVAETRIAALRGEVPHLLDALEEHPDLGLAMLRSAARVLADLHETLDRLKAARGP